MPQLYWNYERPVARYAAVAFEAGIAGVINSEIGETDVPTMALPAAGVAIDAVALHDIAADALGDWATELNKYTPAKAAATFAVGAQLAVTAAGKFQTATAGQLVVAKAVQAATAVDQIVTVERVAPYELPA